MEMRNETASTPERFRMQMREAFQKVATGYRVMRLRRNSFVYTSGQQDSTIYYIVSGQVKLLMPSPEGRECFLAVRTAGDIFGELCLSGQTMRFETAITMKDTMVKQIPHRIFLAYLKNESMIDGLVQYLTVRIAEQQEVITTLTTLKSEQRLARMLIRLSRVLGRNQSCGTCIQQRMSQEELAKMVGTTRTRIGIFLKRFRDLGLIHSTREGCIVINEAGLKNFLERDASLDDDDLHIAVATADCPAEEFSTGASRCGCIPAKLNY
jgi:CRP-like cAMP-binding protein